MHSSGLRISTSGRGGNSLPHLPPLGTVLVLPISQLMLPIKALTKSLKGALNFSSSAFFPLITDFVEGHCTFINKGSVEKPECFTLSYKELTT